MIRLTYVLRRKPELSLEEFQEYWRTTHGPLVAKHSQRLEILRYVQVHTLDDPVNSQLAGPRGSMEEPYDGVAELWWSSLDSLAVLGTEEGQAAAEELLEDERKFIDLPRSPMWLAHEYPQVNPSPETLVAHERSSLVTLFYCGRPPGDLPIDEMQLYWRTAHGPLIRSLAQAMRIQRYIQVHRFEHELEGILREARGTATEPYFGHAELWLDRSAWANAQATPEGTKAGELAVEDESKFVDFERSAMWIAKERVLIDRR